MSRSKTIPSFSDLKLSPKSLGLILVIAVAAWMVGYAVQLPMRYSRLSHWRDDLMQNAMIDFTVIKSLLTQSMPDTISQSIDQLAKGKLAWSFEDQEYEPQQDHHEESWTSEPGGFQRLKLVHRWKSDANRWMSATLIRRFSEEEISRVVGHPILVANLSGLFGAIVAFVLLRQKDVAERESEWIQRFSSRIEQQQDGMRAGDWVGVREQLAQGIYALADSMKRQIALVRQTHERSSQAMTSMPIGILTFNEKLKLDFANPAGKALLDIQFAEAGQRLIEVIRIPSVFDCILQTHQSGIVNEVEIQLNQGRTSLRLKAIPIGSDQDLEQFLSSGGLTKEDTSTTVGEKGCRVLVSIADETRLRQLENLRRDFTANVSHELKTPLAAIKAYAETLLMGAMDDHDARQHFIMRIEEQALRLEALIADLLQLSRLQSQPDKPPLHPLAIVDVLKSCIDDHIAIAERRSVTITLEPSDKVYVNSDLESLQTILGNVLSNAIRYNKPNGQVFVSAKATEKECVVRIRDTGIGIPPEDIERIFERFYRVEKARSQDTGGTGLGLSIVKHLCQLVSAELDVSSQLGEGSLFEITLPLAQA